MCNKIVALAKDDAVWPEGNEEPIGRLINIGTSLYMSHGLKRLKRDGSRKEMKYAAHIIAERVNQLLEAKE